MHNLGPKYPYHIYLVSEPVPVPPPFSLELPVGFGLSGLGLGANGRPMKGEPDQAGLAGAGSLHWIPKTRNATSRQRPGV